MRWLASFCLAVSLALALAGETASRVSASQLTIQSPPRLEAAAGRLREIDTAALADALARAGLPIPANVHVTLVANDDPRARATPDWIVGLAVPPVDVLILPERVAPYPYSSIESVLRHEIVHLALDAQAGGRPLPRWFHEGVAVSVEAGWNVTSSLRLVLATLAEPGIADLTRLFDTGEGQATTLAYLLAAALLDDLRKVHGAGVPGAIAARVSENTPFARAFILETGETPDAAAARAWQTYTRWTAWLPFATSSAAIWALTLGLAFAAFFVRMYRKARRRRAWDGEDDDIVVH
jgi:hypothetical protein